MNLTGQQLLDLSQKGRTIDLKVLPTSLLWNNHSVLASGLLYVSPAAYQLIEDDPDNLDSVIAGLDIDVYSNISGMPALSDLDWSAS